MSTYLGYGIYEGTALPDTPLKKLLKDEERLEQVIALAEANNVFIGTYYQAEIAIFAKDSVVSANLEDDEPNTVDVIGMVSNFNKYNETLDIFFDKLYKQFDLMPMPKKSLRNVYMAVLPY